MPPTLLDRAEDKRAQITAWIATAIGIRDARDRGLVQITNPTMLRNWTCKEALFDFAHQAAQSAPILVRLDERRGALFTLPKPATPTRPRYPFAGDDDDDNDAE